jgi:hypothetical protein
MGHVLPSPFEKFSAQRTENVPFSYVNIYQQIWRDSVFLTLRPDYSLVETRFDAQRVEI